MSVMKALIIIAKQGFQDGELKGTRDGLLEKKYQITIASTEVGPCTGKFGSTEQANIALRNAKVSDYDLIAYIGGPGAHSLAENEDAKRIARDTVAAGKILGAICIAPTILAKAGLLTGKRATVWDRDGEQSKLFASIGAVYTGEPVTIDGKIITGNGPEAAVEFGRKLAQM